MLRYSETLGFWGIDSLLTSLVADNITRTQHDSDRELIGQGIGNLALIHKDFIYKDISPCIIISPVAAGTFCFVSKVITTDFVLREI